MSAEMIRIAALSVAGFFRCGRHWPFEGEVVAVTDLTEADLARIRAEPRLRVTPVDPDRTDDGQSLRAAITQAIAALPPEGFGQDGKPKLDALRAALPEVAPRDVTGTLRDEVWDSLKTAA